MIVANGGGICRAPNDPLPPHIMTIVRAVTGAIVDNITCCEDVHLT